MPAPTKCQQNTTRALLVCLALLLVCVAHLADRCAVDATSINIFKHRYPFYGGYGYGYPFYGGWGHGGFSIGKGSYGGFGRR